jgi:uncharacterized damage-inducible protein DinB
MQPLSVRLMLDAMSEFDRVVDALPAPGRGGRIGRLNAGAYTLMHIAFTIDHLLRFTTGSELDGWVQANAGPAADPEQPPPFDDAEAALGRMNERLRTYLETVDEAEKARQPEGLPEGWAGATVEYILTNAASHTLVHAGEMSALASLVGAPDLQLPGIMPAVRGESA